MRLKEVGEFGLIDRIRSKVGALGGDVLAAIGDDCAAVKLPSGADVLLVTTDMLIEDVHFRRDLMGWRRLGAKSMAVNLSDVAAMGGKPKWAFISIALTDDLAVEDVESFYEGAIELGRKYGVDILGGDTSRAPRKVAVSVSIVGLAEEGRLVRRSGAKPGDLLYVTGTLGDSAAGLDALLGRLRIEALGEEARSKAEICRAKLIEKHLNPEPRLEEAALLARLNLATAMIDLSDGLASDLSHICRESGAGCEITVERIPISDELDCLSPCLPKKAFDYAARGGEDYELLFAIRPQDAGRLEEAWRGRKTPITELGSIREARCGLTLASEAGWTKVLKPAGHDHFARAELDDSS